MKTKTKLALTTAVAAGIIFLATGNHNPKITKNLESKLPFSPIVFLDSNNLNYADLGISMQVGEIRNFNQPTKHVNPDLLEKYKASYEAPFFPKSRGKIIEARLGFFKNSRFVAPTDGKGRYWTRHIEKPEHIFDSGHPDMPNYYWEITIEKPEEMKEVDYKEKYSQGFKIKRESKPGILIFPTLDIGRFCYCESAYQIPAWNKGICGIYEDAEATSNKPQECLFQVISPIKSAKELELVGFK